MVLTLAAAVRQKNSEWEIHFHPLYCLTHHSRTTPLIQLSEAVPVSLLSEALLPQGPHAGAIQIEGAREEIPTHGGGENPPHGRTRRGRGSRRQVHTILAVVHASPPCTPHYRGHEGS